MAEFINTIDALGDDVVIDSIIQGTITEFKDNVLKIIGQSAFCGCKELTTVDAPSITDLGRSALQGCNKIESVNFPELITIHPYSMQRCTAIKSIVLPKATFLGTYAMSGCTGLISAEFHAVVEFGHEALAECSNLSSVILRNKETVSSIISSGVLKKTQIASGTGYIYVPRALVDSYKAETNWATYAAQFRALEDYTVDGTITGELDETKI